MWMKPSKIAGRGRNKLRRKRLSWRVKKSKRRVCRQRLIRFRNSTTLLKLSTRY